MALDTTYLALYLGQAALYRILAAIRRLVCGLNLKTLALGQHPCSASVSALHIVGSEAWDEIVAKILRFVAMALQ